MKKIFFTTGMYLAKTLGSPRFWLAAAAYIGLLFIISQDLFSSLANVPYIMHYAFANSTSYFLLVICALPCAAVFADEWKEKRFVSVYTRAKKLGFSASVIVSSFLSALLVSMTASVIFLALISIKYPIGGNSTDMGFVQQMDTYANGDLLVSGNRILYYFSDLLIQGCLMGVFSAMSTMFSIKLTDPHICVVLPMVLYIVITNFCGILKAPVFINPYNVYSHSGYLFRTFFPDSERNFSVISMLYPFIYTLFFLAIFIAISHFWIKRKYENYNDIG